MNACHSGQYLGPLSFLPPLFHDSRFLRNSPSHICIYKIFSTFRVKVQLAEILRFPMTKHFYWFIYLFNAHTPFSNKFAACDRGPGVRLKLGVSLGSSRALRTQHVLCTPSDGVSPFSVALRRPAGIFFFLKTPRTCYPRIQFDHASS